jgi:O-antigen/teichoic acid export membrane protein
VRLANRAVVGPLTPLISRYYTAGKYEKLQTIIYKTTMFGVAAVTLLSTALLALRNEYLQLFGEDYTSGEWPLILLVLGVIINVAIGPTNEILSMIGEEKKMSYTNFGGGLLNIVLNSVLIPYIGIYGAVAGKVFGIGFINISQSYVTYKQGKLRSSILLKYTEDNST